MGYCRWSEKCHWTLYDGDDTYRPGKELIEENNRLSAELEDTKEDFKKMLCTAQQISKACMYSPPIKEENILIEPRRCTHKDTESGCCLIEECPLQK